MDIPLISATELGDVDPVDGRRFLQLREGLLQVQVSAAWKVQVDLAGCRGPEGTDRPLGRLTLEFFLRQGLPLHLRRQEFFGEAPDVLGSPWPAIITSPLIRRWKSMAETSLPEDHPSVLLFVRT